MIDYKVLVLEGGFNEEHEISFSTAREVKKSLCNLDIEFESIIVSPKNFKEKIKKFNNEYICFNALHGPYGEDGQIQRILDKLSFRYTHSDSKASKIGFDKALSKKAIINNKILTPGYLLVDHQSLNEAKIIEIFSKLGPCILKPASSGSSFGIKIFNNIDDINLFSKNLENNLLLYKNHNKLLIEKYIKGRELTVAVLEKNKESYPIEVTEIISNSEFFNYDAKYSPGIARHILPAKIPKQIYESCKQFAKIAHDTINCRGVSRSDFIYDDDNIYFIEINTQPGLTAMSLVPEQLKYQNISFDKMVINLLECVL